MKKHTLAFIDVETTGTDPEKHEIIEFACILAKQVPKTGAKTTLEVIEEFEYKIKPEHIETADPEALDINGYTEAGWMFGIDLKQAIGYIAKKTENAIMVAHNVTFDWVFLEKAFEKTNIQNKMHFHKLDTMSMAFAILYDVPEMQRFSLEALCKYYNIENKKAHTALSDVVATKQLYEKLLGIETDNTQPGDWVGIKT